MTPLMQLNKGLHYIFIAFLLACFAIAQSARAATPEPNGSDTNVAEDDNAMPDFSTGTGNDVMGQPNPKELGGNKWMIPIDFTRPLQCAGGNVSVHADLVITFAHILGKGVSPESVKLQAFRGTAVPGNRPLEHKKTGKLTFGGIDVVHENGQGRGKVGIKFEVTGPGLPGAEKPLLFKVEYAPLSWEFKDGKVTSLKGALEVRCLKK